MHALPARWTSWPALPMAIQIAGLVAVPLVVVLSGVVARPWGPRARLRTGAWVGLLVGMVAWTWTVGPGVALLAQAGVWEVGGSFASEEAMHAALVHTLERVLPWLGAGPWLFWLACAGLGALGAVLGRSSPGEAPPAPRGLPWLLFPTTLFFWTALPIFLVGAKTSVERLGATVSMPALVAPAAGAALAAAVAVVWVGRELFRLRETGFARASAALGVLGGLLGIASSLLAIPSGWAVQSPLIPFLLVLVGAVAAALWFGPKAGPHPRLPVAPSLGRELALTAIVWPAVVFGPGQVLLSLWVVFGMAQYLGYVGIEGPALDDTFRIAFFQHGRGVVLALLGGCALLVPTLPLFFIGTADSPRED